MTASIRVSVDADAEGIVARRRAQYPYAVVTPVTLRHHWAHERPAAKALRLVADDGGQIVAVGRASFNTWTAVEGATNLGLLVDRGYRGQGIGTRLYETLMD